MPHATATASTAPAAPAAGDVLAWALGRGHPVGSAAMRTVIGAARGVAVWTQETVSELVWAGVIRWCRAAGQSLPDGVPEALWLYLGYLDETGGLDGASDPLAVLRRPLRIWSGLDQEGRARPVRTTRRTRPPAGVVVAFARPAGRARFSRPR